MARLKTVFLALVVFLFPGLLLAGPEGHQPKLVVTPANLNFFTCEQDGQEAPAPGSKTVEIRAVPRPNNADGPLIHWTAAPDQNWIKIAPAGGSTPSQAQISVDPAGLTVGEYTGVIEFNTSGQEKPRLVQIKFRIQTAVTAGFSLNPAGINFSGEAFSNITLLDSVQLGVVGADQIDFIAANSQTWLQIAPNQATAPRTIHLMAATDSLQPGTYHDTVVFSAHLLSDANGEGGEHCSLDEITARLPVMMTLSPNGQPSLLTVSPGRLGFDAVFGGPNPQPQNLSISALGNDDIPWTAGASQSWLVLNPADGTATELPSQTQVTIDIAGLNPGSYMDTIIFVWPQEGAFETKVPVFLEIFPLPELSDSVAIGDGIVDLTDPQINRFSVPVFASNKQAVFEIDLPLHFEDGNTTLDTVTFSDRVDYAHFKEFDRLAAPGNFVVRISFFGTEDLPPGEGTICWLHFTTTGVLPQFVDTLEIDSSASVLYLVTSSGNDLIVNPAFKKGTVILRNFQVPTSADDGDGHRPLRFGLNQNYPNPFNPQTAIAFSLPKSSEVRLEVFDLLGRSVVTLKDGSMPAGTHTIVWDGRDRSGRTVSSGIYLYRFQAGSFWETKKMLFLK